MWTVEPDPSEQYRVASIHIISPPAPRRLFSPARHPRASSVGHPLRSPPPRSRRRPFLPAGAIFAIFEQQLLLNTIPFKTSESTLSAIRSWEGISHESNRNRRKSPEGRKRRSARPGGPGRGRGGGVSDHEVPPQ